MPALVHLATNTVLGRLAAVPPGFAPPAGARLADDAEADLLPPFWPPSAPPEPSPPAEPDPGPLVPLAVVTARVTILGGEAALRAVLDAEPAAKAAFLALREGIYQNDALARALLAAAGMDPDVVLA